MTGARALSTLGLALAVLGAACGQSSRDPLATFPLPPLDASVDAPADAGDDAPDGDASGLGRPCTDDPQCDDGVACTYDSCDPVLRRCRNVPDDAQCSDGLYCDGRERCVPFHGCEPGPVVSCDDADPCTIDSCDEARQACAHAPRDADSDGDPDAHCVAHRDCDDLDPTAASTHAEVCGNKKDDNCNGLVDEQPCVTAADATCATALAVSAAGTYRLDTTGAPETYRATCSVSAPSSAHQVVALVTLPAGGPHDLEAWVTATTGEVAVAIQATCGDATSERACGGGHGGSSARALGRSLAPGTYAVIVTSQVEGVVELAVDIRAPTQAPANVDCTAPSPLTPGTSITASLVDASLQLQSACTAAVGELTYALTLAAASDVRVYASATRGAGTPVVGLRRSPCGAPLANEQRCHGGGGLPLFVRAVPAGTYVVTLAATASIDASLLVQTSPATQAPPDQTCATAPPLTPNVAQAVDLSNQEAAIADGCSASSPDAAFALPLARASDVLLVARFPQTEGGAVSLDAPSCDADAGVACAAGATPTRVGKRNVPAGDYRVVLADGNGASDTQVTAYVRDTVPPVAVTGSDDCAAPFEIPAAGGFFTGDTTGAHPDFADSCDGPSGGAGANDQVLHLRLGSTQRVVLDAEGSSYVTILDVRTGATCPGAEVPGDCYVGFGASRSFLDLTLAAGDYWIVVDGYLGQKGPWALDVRVLSP